ncbi:MAG: hypothetical protein ACKVWV_11520 [Planctomycetota bacterium]
MSSRLLCALVFLAVPLVGTSFAQGPGGAPPGKWKVGDDGVDTLATIIAQARTYRVGNGGPDSTITAEVYNENEELINVINIPGGETRDMGVPAGGSLKIRDAADDDGFAAAGSYGTI